MFWQAILDSLTFIGAMTVLVAILGIIWLGVFGRDNGEGRRDRG